MKKIIFSGVAPSGNIHIGNYLGALKNWVELQKKNKSIFCIVDMHAITLPRNPKELRKKIIEVAKIYLAAGIDPDKSTIFVQSHVPQHAELMWILNTISKTNELFRMTQFKDKARLNRDKSEIIDNVPLGILNYPVLMAADILLYDTDIVPVGEDQLQHIELTKALAKRFNNTFGDTFKIPNAYVRKEGMRIMGLDNPLKKMSKSAHSEYNYLSLNDHPDLIRKKIQRAVTDSGNKISYNDNKPALMNLINIYSLLSNISIDKIEKNYSEKGYREFKTDLAEVIVKFLAPFQKKIAAISEKEVLEILRKGAMKVRPIAKNKLDIVKEKIGFVL